MGRGLGPVQRQILGVAYITQELLQKRGEAEGRPQYAHRLGLWAIYRYPASGKRGIPNTPTVRAARAALSRSVAGLEERGLLDRYRRSSWTLTEDGEWIGKHEAAPFRGLIDLEALCGLEFLRDSGGVALREYGCSLAELRARLSERVRDGTVLN
jgi:hypothetical protein